MAIPASSSLSFSHGRSDSGQSLKRWQGKHWSIHSTLAHVAHPTNCLMQTLSRPKCPSAGLEYVSAAVKFWMILRLSGGRTGIASSCSASQSMRFTASPQLWCSSSQCFHNAGISMKPFPHRQHVRGGCITASLRSVASAWICCTKCGGEGAFTCEAGVYTGFGIQY